MEKNKPQDEELKRFRAEAAELLGIPEPANEKNVTRKEERSPESE